MSSNNIKEFVTIAIHGLTTIPAFYLFALLSSVIWFEIKGIECEDCIEYLYTPFILSLILSPMAIAIVLFITRKKLRIETHHITTSYLFVEGYCFLLASSIFFHTNLVANYIVLISFIYLLLFLMIKFMIKAIL